MRFTALLTVALLTFSAPAAFAQCVGYSGPGGACYTGPGGGLYTGPGGGAYTGPGARCGYVVGMPLTGMRMERGFAPTTSGAVVSIRTDFPSISAQITTQLKGLS